MLLLLYHGLIAGILNKFGKIGVIVGFFLGNILLTFVLNGNVAQIIYLKEILMASIGLLLVPDSIEINIDDLIGKSKLLAASKERMLQENEDTIYKLNSVSDTISEISKSYEEAAATILQNDADNTYEMKKEIFIDEVIKNMEDIPNNMFYEDIIDEENGILGDIFDVIKEKNKIFMQDVIEVFGKHNSYIIGLDDNDLKTNIEKDLTEIVKIINNCFQIHKINFAWEKQINETNKNISKGLDDISKVITDVANNINNKEEDFKKEKEEIEILLLQKNIGIYDIDISRRKNGKVIVNIYTRVKNNIVDETNKIQKIEEVLSKVFKESISLYNEKKNIDNDEGKTLQTYISDDKLKMTVAISSHTMDGSDISGDSSLKTKLDDGTVILALSDGMGSGQKANKASLVTIKLIKKMLSAGFDKNIALELINTQNAANKKEELFTSIDVSIIDLYKCNIELLKNYACPTYIKRGNEVKMIHAISLPTGLLNNVDSIVFDTEIKKGDIIVMCTDGVIESNKYATNKEEALKNFLQNMKSENVKKIADIILNEAIDMDYGKAEDDMTVIVAKIS